MAWPCRSKTKWPGRPAPLRLSVDPASLAKLAGSVDGLHALLENIPDRALRARIFSETLPLVLKAQRTRS